MISNLIFYFFNWLIIKNKYKLINYFLSINEEKCKIVIDFLSGISRLAASSVLCIIVGGVVGSGLSGAAFPLQSIYGLDTLEVSTNIRFTFKKFSMKQSKISQLSITEHL